MIYSVIDPETMHDLSQCQNILSMSTSRPIANPPIDIEITIEQIRHLEHLKINHYQMN